MIMLYLAFVSACILVTVLVARVLSQNGAVLLEDVFPGKPEMARAINQLLVAGFYMINLGFCFISLPGIWEANGLAINFRNLANSFGGVLLALGVMHFLNLLVFSRIRRRAHLPNAPLPVPPHFHAGAR